MTLVLFFVENEMHKYVNFNILVKSVCQLTKYMSKFHISTQILQGNALFSGKNYTAKKNFTRPPVVTVEKNFKSASEVSSLFIFNINIVMITNIDTYNNGVAVVHFLSF